MTILSNPVRNTRFDRRIALPDAILFDMDGVLADVSGSYRICIQKTAAEFGVALSTAEISEAKHRLGANNDWILTQQLLLDRSVKPELSDITDVFQSLYLGSSESPGLRENEKLLIDPEFLIKLASQYSLGIVTGRPRKEATYFLERFKIVTHFETTVCLEDAPSKPDPAGVRLAAAVLKARSPWMIGDTPDDMRAARAASAGAIGICGSQDQAMKTALVETGAQTVLENVNDLEFFLP